MSSIPQPPARPPSKQLLDEVRAGGASYEPLLLPFQHDVVTRPGARLRPRWRSPQLSREARASGHRVVAPRAGSRYARLLGFLQLHGASTDHAVAEGLGLALATVNSLRGQLVKDGLIRAFDHVSGLNGARRTRWGLAAHDAESKRTRP